MMDIVEQLIVMRDMTFTAGSGRKLHRFTRSERDLIADACNVIVSTRNEAARLRNEVAGLRPAVDTPETVAEKAKLARRIMQQLEDNT
jgi:hypothetical protein